MPPIRRGLPRALLLALALAGCGGDDGGSPIAATPPSSAEVLERGPYGVGVTTAVFLDESRPTMPNGTFAGAPSRRLATEIWYPTAPGPEVPADGLRDAPLDRDGAPYPLVVYSHGFLDQRNGAGYLVRHLASHGYIVTATDYPLTHFSAPGGANGGDVVNQPEDLRFVLERMLAGGIDGRFAGAIDGERIGAAGLSLGGLTTMLTTFHRDLREPRIRAAASIAGPACSFSEAFFATADVPLLILHGDIDAIVPYQHALHAFERARSPKLLFTILGAAHTAFTQLGVTLFETVDNSDSVGCMAIGGGPPRDSDNGFAESLGGAEAGIIPSDCPGACSMPPPLPRAIRPSRQHQITILAVFPFFEAYLRDRAEMHAYLREVAPAENAEVLVEID
jgi:predicted dienelactone hydrolase